MDEMAHIIGMGGRYKDVSPKVRILLYITRLYIHSRYR